MNIFSGFGRLYRGETTVDYYGKRKPAFIISGAFMVVTVVALVIGGLNLGIDFKGGVAWEAPASATFGEAQVREVLEANDVETANAKIQVLSGTEGQRIRAQVGDQPDAVRQAVQQALAEKAGVDVQDVSVARVSSSWGRSITEKAIRALLVFFLLVSLYIAWRFEWKMALAAIAAMAHDVLISVGIYAVLRFEVTPATVVAFLTILGYSLYDTVVVFDKVRENIDRFASSRISMGNIVNVSSNQVLARSLNTTLSSALPVVSLLVVGSIIMGATSLQEFAIALLVGMLTGTYSSIFVATPLYAVMKNREQKYAAVADQVAKGAEMAALFEHSTTRAAQKAAAGEAAATRESQVLKNTASNVLTHPPRPRKRRRR
ncbi:MAG: protein translocase subunit SecF [Ilumatobacteraceae bacterium]|nr:protein translocase subunit SecF [Actinomycetota bacterium]NCV97034.1 protein translocase subunit SecF [Acidimicrobiia bacterium]NBS36835.1 protein translocase subunit SecF [Actinomycetota bacterium]NCV09172.1 protein translocase subunit SecF [Actinomycetota bacterium]NCV47575.1 protein translocase subunit SecF [Actinomycetota bacterium]